MHRPENMTARQLDRRRRVLDAVHELLASVPVADVQVKDIAERSGVSLAAIYNYFRSKDALLGEALVDWAHGLGARRRSGSTSFTDLVRQGVRAYGRAPQYADVYLRTAASDDPHAVDCMARLSDDVGGTLRSSLTGLDDSTAATIERVIGNAWMGGMFECVHGRQTFAQLERILVKACGLLLEAAGQADQPPAARTASA